MSSKQRQKLIGLYGNDFQGEILTELDDIERIVFERSLKHPEISVGRLVQIEIARAPERRTLGDAIDFLRSSENLPDQVYHLILVNAKINPVGHVTLVGLISSQRHVTLLNIVKPVFHVISAFQNETEEAY